MERLHGLDALRGIAALVVFALHYETWTGVSDWFSAGWLAVDLFFVLSGYVLAGVYEPRFAAGMTAWQFMAARFRRLWLPFAIGCTIGLVYLLVLRMPHAVPSYFLSLAFLPTPFIPRHAFGINQPGWSLFFELVANLIHVGVLARTPTRRLLVYFLILAGFFIVASVRQGGPLFGTEFVGFPGAFLRSMACYCLGILLCRARIRQWRIDGWWAIAAMPACIVAAGFVPPTIHASLFALAISPLLVLGARRMNTAIGLATGVATGLGALSYPLYAIHEPLLMLCLHMGLAGWAGAVLCLAAAAAIAALSGPQTRWLVRMRQPRST